MYRDTAVIRENTAEPFGLWDRMDLRNHVVTATMATNFGTQFAMSGFV